MHLGFVVKPLARPELKSHDSRRWQNSPHLSVSLAYLRDIFTYLAAARIRMYRMTADLAPYATHPGMPQFHGQVGDCAAELADAGAAARAAGLRLSFHPGQHLVLNSPDERAAQAAAADLALLAALLNAMALGPEAVIVTHLGGVYGDRAAARDRFAARFLALPDATRRRVVVENDDSRFGVADVLWVHDETGAPVVFDVLHHRLNNPQDLPVRAALGACLATWPAGVRPKVHFSSPRTEWRVTPAGSPEAAPVLRQTRWAYHSDYINPFEFIDFMAGAAGLPEFDIMLEARAKDLALLQLRRDLARFAPGLSAREEQ